MVFFISAISPTGSYQREKHEFCLKNSTLRMTGEKKACEAGFSLLG